MPRTPSIWLRTSTGWWMTTLNGEQVRLAKDKKEAARAFHELMAKAGDAGEPATRRLSFRKLADQFLAHCHRTLSPQTFALRRLYLQSFCDHVGRRAVADLRVEHVTAWEAKSPHWSQSTVATVRGALAACLNWGVEQGVIDANPLARMRAVAYTRRERTLTPDEAGRIKAAASPAFRDFILALQLTGARPFSEVGRVTAAMVDFASGTITFEKHKTAKKGKRRVIYLTPPLEGLLRRKIAEHPHGVLFLTTRGNPWTKAVVTRQLRTLERRTGVARLCLYALRHTMITDALEKGVSAEVVAELVGNSPATLTKYYSKLSERTNALKAAAAKIVG